jgi:predicted O-methyltransferase YrrM
MSEEFIIDTTQNVVREVQQCRDPYDHLPADEWVDKQIEYGQIESNISGRGLLPFIQELTGEIVGCEIGVCHGFTTEYFLKNTPTIKKVYVVDNYPAFVDWDGTRITAERQEVTKRLCKSKLEKFGDKVVFAYESSVTFAQTLEDDSLDYVFVDGDHSYEATLADIQNYWPKVKKGGIFAGHDINLTSVDNAVKEFFKETPVKVVENNAWFLIK